MKKFLRNIEIKKSHNMKGLLTILLVIVSVYIFSQKIYTSISNQEQYLFLGSRDGNKLKVLNSENNQVLWINKEKLEQVDQLSPEDFINKVFWEKLIFIAEGDEPFWRVEINRNFLIFSDPADAERNKYEIQINTNKQDLISSTVLMFHNSDKTIYGVIRRLSGQTACTLCICEEESLL